MAGFKAHLSTGIATGLPLAMVGLYNLSLTIVQTVSVFGLCTVGSILPDMDSDTSRPFSWLLRSMAAILTVTWIWLSFTGDFIEFKSISVFLFSAAMLFWFLRMTLKRLTVHRGIFHSVPAAVLFAQAVYLGFLSSGEAMALCSAISAFIGVFSHLILDELSAVGSGRFFPRLKGSFGSAMKFRSGSCSTTILVYALVVLLTITILFTSDF